jgi:D-xylose 1-dehydrogenase
VTATYEDLRGRAAVVTGGASGIGEAIVRALAAQGCRVGFLDIQADAGTALAAELGAAFVACDLLDIEALRRAITALHDRIGPPRVLVNNAANDQRQAFGQVTPDQFDWMMGVNLRHVYFASQAVVPAMRDAGGGSIVNMSSVAWMAGGRDMQAYSAAKAAIVGFTNSLARDVGPHGIRVNAVAPGMVITERQRRLWYEDAALIEAGRARQSLPGAITPDDIAQAVLFLASDASRMITKQCLVVNAGSR